MANMKGQNADVFSYTYVPKCKNMKMRDFNSTNANITIKFAAPRVAITLYTKH